MQEVRVSYDVPLFFNMEHKCLITRALRSAGRGRLSRNTSIVGGLWIFHLFSLALSLPLTYSAHLGAPWTPSSLFEEDFCRMGVYKQINFLRQQCTSLRPSAVCVHLIACPPRRHALVKATVASVPCLFPSVPPTLPLFSAVVLCVSWQGTVSVGGLAWPPLLSCVMSPHCSPTDPPAKALPSSLILQITAATSAACKQTPSWSQSLELTLCGHPLSCLRPISVADETWLCLCILYGGLQQCDVWFSALLA